MCHANISKIPCVTIATRKDGRLQHSSQKSFCRNVQEQKFSCLPLLHVPGLSEVYTKSLLKRIHPLSKFFYKCMLSCTKQARVFKHKNAMPITVQNVASSRPASFIVREKGHNNILKMCLQFDIFG